MECGKLHTSCTGSCELDIVSSTYFAPVSDLMYEPRQAKLCLRAFRHDKFKLRMPSH